MKGQLTLSNMFILVITFVLYFAMMPLINTVGALAVADLMASPNEYTVLNVAFIYLTPLLITLALVMTAFHWAQPRPQSPYG